MSFITNAAYKIVLSKLGRIAHLKSISPKNRKSTEAKEITNQIEKLEEEADRALDSLETLEQISVTCMSDLHKILEVKTNDQWKGNQISIDPYSVDPSSTEYSEITKIAEEHDLKIMPYDIDYEVQQNK
ncbi:hypothetical protein Pyn_05011 [Prunus yedoensis var. nudiflora]|uniref:Uncharacterized protein n=1 Tax=Prunus yedoensis var. nudiflora TaxID=2094558 RepID=A0A315ACL0_PRUYE|nr:hypothetical protein Pyn_05011 [Prunus yedoensis var. nudiflora]